MEVDMKQIYYQVVVVVVVPIVIIVAVVLNNRPSVVDVDIVSMILRRS